MINLLAPTGNKWVDGFIVIVVFVGIVAILWKQSQQEDKKK